MGSITTGTVREALIELLCFNAADVLNAKEWFLEMRVDPKEVRAVVVVNNYNYGQYVCEALESLLSQTRAPDSVIVVDDGSTDDSVERISAFVANHGNIVLVEKKNAGQLSCFNEAVRLVAEDDIVFFLDSDDIYPPDYIQSVLEHIDAEHDFYFAETIKFGGPVSSIESTRISDAAPCSIGITSALTRRHFTWIGSPTSAIAMRGSALKDILPYSDERGFKVRADDMLVYSSSILGHKKKYLPSLAIAYRVHGSNNFYGKGESPETRHFLLEKLFTEMVKRAGVQMQVAHSAAFAEFTMIPVEYRKRFCLPSALRMRVQWIGGKLARFLGLT